MKLLIDCDFVVYKCCAAAESEIDFGDDVIIVTSTFKDAYSCVKRELNRIANKFGSFDEMILFFSDSKNFRKDIQKDYKGHRNRKKPCGYRRVIKKLTEEYSVIRMPTLEADDSMGIYSTKFPGNIIVSPDKDMRTIPCKLLAGEDLELITRRQADRNWMAQALTGDTTDNYKGITGVGSVTANKILGDAKNLNDMWDIVVKEYEKKQGGYKEALLTARLARILRSGDYNTKTGKVKLWKP